jgi:uncharacterized protein (TIGR02284 family)
MQTAALWKNYDKNHRPAALAALGDIIDACHDAERGYTHARDLIQDPRVKEIFASYAEQRRSFAEILDEWFELLGEKRPPRASIAGIIHRKWLDIRSVIDENAALAMLSECERGEYAAAKRYEHALGIPLPAPLRDTLLEQVAEIRRTHDELDRMRGH